MLRILFTVLLITGFSLGLSAQTRPGDGILGEWITEETEYGYARVNIYRVTDGTYQGKIVYLSKPNRANGTPKLDEKNSDKALQTRPVLGLVIMRGFVYDADDKEWEDGKVYDASSGSDYSAYMALEPDGRLKLRGYVGVSLLGRTSYWKRAAKN